MLKICQQRPNLEDSDEDDIDATKIPERTDEDLAAALTDVRIEDQNQTDKLHYKRIARHYLSDLAKRDDRKAILTSASYHKVRKILVSGKIILEIYIF